MRPTQATRARLTVRSVLAVMAAALLLGACGSAQKPPATRSTTTTTTKPVTPQIDIYSALPTVGKSQLAQDGRAVERGIDLALGALTDHRRIDGFHLTYRRFRDPVMSDGTTNPVVAAAHARAAAIDPRAILFIGGLDAGATQASAPILNEAGIAQISPGSLSVGLSESVKDLTAENEPQRYFPTGTRTLFQLMPNDAVQAEADLDQAKQADCVKVVAAAETDTEGAVIVGLMADDQKQYGLTVVPETNWTGKPGSVATFAGALRQVAGACFVIAAPLTPEVKQLTHTLHAELPQDMILGTNTLCTRAWVRAVEAGTPATADARLYCTAPTLKLSDYAGAQQVSQIAALYRHAYGRGAMSAYVLYGYQAVAVAVDAILATGDGADDRSEILEEVASDSYDSPLGAFKFTALGTTTLRYYGLYQANAHGGLEFDKTLKLPSSGTA